MGTEYLLVVGNKAEPREATGELGIRWGTAARWGICDGIGEVLDVVVATPPGTGRSCLGRWFSSSHRLLDAASAAALYRDFIMHYLLATPTWTRTWKASAAANIMP